MFDNDRLFPTDKRVSSIARDLYERCRHMPIISPHGHTDAGWFAANQAFVDPVSLLIQPDHYIYRMLYSQGVPLESLGIKPTVPTGKSVAVDKPEIWRLFAANIHLFRGTPSNLWFNHVLREIFGLDEPLCPSNADAIYKKIATCLAQDRFLPRTLFTSFNIEFLATTESPLDSLEHHEAIRQSDWHGRVATTFRPDPVVDPEYDGFADALARLSSLTGRDAHRYQDYLEALRQRRLYFVSMGATATDHGHPTAATANLTTADAASLFETVVSGKATAPQAELFRAHMLTVMAEMSLEDGLVMQIHPGVYRNHNRLIFEHFGRDRGADIPQPTDFVNGLKPLLDRFGNESTLTIILFTLDEATYSRELAPLAGHYPALRLGPAWWFHDSPEGMRRFRWRTLETAGFYNTVGFNDDTRAFLSIPARHDMARRIDCGVLAEMVADCRLANDQAVELIGELTCGLARRAYRL